MGPRCGRGRCGPGPGGAVVLAAAARGHGAARVPGPARGAVRRLPEPDHGRAQAHRRGRGRPGQSGPELLKGTRLLCLPYGGFERRARVCLHVSVEECEVFLWNEVPTLKATLASNVDADATH